MFLKLFYTALFIGFLCMVFPLAVGILYYKITPFFDDILQKYSDYSKWAFDKFK